MSVITDVKGFEARLVAFFQKETGLLESEIHSLFGPHIKAVSAKAQAHPAAGAPAPVNDPPTPASDPVVEQAADPVPESKPSKSKPAA